jgi:hypothetical protein
MIYWIPWITTYFIEIDKINVLIDNLCLIKNIADPIIYAFLTKRFRNDFKLIFIDKLKFNMK